MRCGCPACGAYMIHAEGVNLGCVCPVCARRCADCLGTDTLLSREQIRSMREEPDALLSLFQRRNPENAPPERDFEPPGPEEPM
ncbi:MAG: hypothetical protein GX592_08410 [Clostridiales bacterium]|nr:hypothetical protein [Clostridiales bacterium]